MTSSRGSGAWSDQAPRGDHGRSACFAAGVDAEHREAVTTRGNGVLALRSVVLASAPTSSSVLTWRDEIVSAAWPDHLGSVGHEILARERSAEANERIHAAFDRGSEEPLQVACADVLALLPAGTHTLRRFEHRTQVIWPRLAGPTTIAPLVEVYPEPEVLVATTARERLDETRIAHYRRAFEAGLHPTVLSLAAPDGFVAFVLDGHHKLAAAESLRCELRVVEIVTEPSPLDAETLRAWMGASFERFASAATRGAH